MSAIASPRLGISPLIRVNTSVSSVLFTTMTAKASELIPHAAGLGAELLAALEKKDGEALARLRDDQEVAVLNSVRAVKLATIEEAKGAVEALMRSRDVIQQRIDFYSSQHYMNAWEITAVTLNGASLRGETAVGAPTDIPQVRVPGRPHNFSVDHAADPDLCCSCVGDTRRAAIPMTSVRQ